MGDNLRNRAIDGFQWGVIDNFANSGITFLVGLVLAWKLTPVEFGALAIVTIFTNLSITIIDGGFATALIRKNDTDDRDYNTVFYTNFGVSVVLMLLLIAISSFIADFFHHEVLSRFMPLMSSILMINALSIVHKALLVKALNFKSQAIVSLLSSVTSGVAGITAAFAGLGIWSLAIQLILRQTLLTIGLWIISPWRPRWLFSVASFKDLFGFSSKLLLANVINSLYKDIFLAVVGRIYSTYELGLYNRADQFNQICSNNLTMIIQKVSLPVLSQFQNDIQMLKDKFRKISLYSSILTFSLCFGMAATAKPMILILVGEKWLPCVLYLQIMCLYGAIYPLQQLNLNILNTLKRSDYLLKLEMIKKVLFVPVIAVGFFFELKYMIIAAVIYYYVEFFLNSWYSKTLIGYGSWQQVVDQMPVFVISILVSAAVLPFSWFEWNPYAIISIQVVLAFILYNLIYPLSRIKEYYEIRQIIIRQVKRVSHV